jgi:hypothetical protein
MAYLSAGFDGTMYEGPWAQAWPFMGHGPVVENDAAQKVTVATGTRKVRVAVGAGAAAGVYVDLQDVVDITLPDATGSAKYWTIVRRTSGTGTAGNVTWIALGPTTTPVIAGTLIKNPGVTYDSALAIYRITPGSTVPVLMQDLRDTLGELRRGWKDEWVEVTKPGTIEDDSAHGHTWAYRFSAPAGRVEIRGAVKAADGSFSSAGVESNIGSPLPAAARPSRRQYHIGAAAGGSAIPGNVRFYIDTDGQIAYFSIFTPAWMNFDGWVYDTN